MGAVDRVRVGDIEIAHRWDGAADGPVVMMAHAMGTSLRLWDPQVPALADRYRLLRYDWRGHGDTDAPPGPYHLDQFVEDAVALMDALDLERVHWVGISTGGMIGQGLGIHRPERVASLTLCNTTSWATPLVSRMGEGATGGRARKGNGSGLGDDEAALVHRRLRRRGRSRVPRGARGLRPYSRRGVPWRHLGGRRPRLAAAPPPGPRAHPDHRGGRRFGDAGRPRRSDPGPDRRLDAARHRGAAPLLQRGEAGRVQRPASRRPRRFSGT